MMRNLDFSSWQAVLTTLLGLVVVTLLMVGIRLLVMETVQQRRQRENRQINERLRILIAAYKALGGSFTGDLAVDPSHLRDILRQRNAAAEARQAEASAGQDVVELSTASDTFDRSRRIRDAVEAVLSDVILLGTAEQVQLAVRAATDLTEGRPVHTDELVVSLRNFIRKVLDLEPVPATLKIPKQGPARPSSAGGGAKGKPRAGGGDGGAAGQDGKGQRGGGGGGGTTVGAGLGLGLGGGLTTNTDGSQ